MTDQKQRVAVVTGGASGIGKATVSRLRGFGYGVAPVDVSATALHDAWDADPAVLQVPADVTDRGAVEVAGPIATPMGLEAAADPGYRERMLRRVLAKRFATPEDIAGAIAYLLGPDADYVTGHTLNIDGGVLAHR